MGKRFLIFLLIISMPFAARAATCDAGYYLNGTECATCEAGYYCNNDTKYACPQNNADITGLIDGIVLSQTGPFTWGNATKQSSVLQCWGDTYISVSSGEYLAECPYNGANYYEACNNSQYLWYRAHSGYYLSPYKSKSYNTWYSGTKPCTNAPAHAHYTGAGTPDAPDGSIKDANDCPWECDDGYGQRGDACLPLCGAGMRYIKIGNGLRFNLYPVPYSSPTLAVRNNGTVCYGILVPGAATETININRNGTIYHIEN